jgi:hypothetical protein
MQKNGGWERSLRTMTLHPSTLGYQRPSWRLKETQSFANHQRYQVTLLGRMKVNIVSSMKRQVITLKSA